MQYRLIYITHLPSLSSLLSYLQLQGQLLWLAAVMTRPPPKTIFTLHFTQQQLLYCHSPHCHPSLLLLILSNLILQINIQIFWLSLMRFIPKEKNELNKWKNHFVEMKGDVGMSVHEKGGKLVNATPTHKTIYNPIPTSLFF